MDLWGKLPDLYKLGDQLGEVIQKAKDDVEKSIDNTLGIDGHNPATNTANGSQGTTTPSAVIKEDAKEVPSIQKTPVADGLPRTAKRIVKKTVKPVDSIKPSEPSIIPPSSATSVVVEVPVPSSQVLSTSSPAVDIQSESAFSGERASTKGQLAASTDLQVVASASESLATSNVPSVLNGLRPSSDGRPENADSGSQGEPGASSARTTEELGKLGKDDLIQIIQELQAGIALQGEHTHRQAEKLSNYHEVVNQLQTKNEELALKHASISESDFEDMRKEFETRLAATERKMYALTKERDALKKNSEKLVEYGNTIREKDVHIKQIMEEGERLSKKQIDLEGILRKVRQQLAASESECEKLAAKLATEEQNLDAARKAKAKVDRDLAASLEQAKLDQEAQKEAYEALLAKARSEQLEAEERVRAGAVEGAHRKLRESEGRCEALAESVAELREALDRQRQAAGLREEMMAQDMSDMERRCQAAELRHQELVSKMPEATRPLLRQIEAMQTAADAQQEAWSRAEQMLQQRIADAESRWAASGEKERLAADKIQVLSNRIMSLEATLAAARAEVKQQAEALESARLTAAAEVELRASVEAHVAALTERVRVANAAAEATEAAARDDVAVERRARLAAEADAATVRRECEKRVHEVEARLAEQSAPPGWRPWMDRSPEPPAMAAPGYRWMLVKEGEPPPVPGGGGERQESGAAASTSAAADTPGNASSEGGDSLLPPTGPSRGSGPMASESDTLRTALRAKTGEMAAMENQIRLLEVTRDRLAEELLLAATHAERNASMMAELETARADVLQLQIKYTGAVEMLGERDERLEELMADLEDVKQLYKDQIEFMVAQLSSVNGYREAPQTLESSHHPPA